MNLAERFPPTLELANAYSEHAPVISLAPLFARACAYSQRSLEIRRSFGDLWGQGQSLAFYGCVLYYSSRFHECVEQSREAIRLLERMGDYWLVHIARYQLAASLYRLGDLRGAIEECRLNHRSGLELGDEQASGIILDVWTRATGGVVPDGLLETELERSGRDAQGAAQVLLAEGVRLLEAGELSRAAETLQTAIHVAHRAGVKNAYTIPAFAWLVTALRRQAEQCDPYQPSRRRALVRQASQAVRRAIRASRICANDLPHILRDAALLAAMQDRRREAKRLFHQGLAVAQAQNARYEYAQTLLAYGRVGRAWGWPSAEQRMADAQAILHTLLPAPANLEANEVREAPPVTLSLADRFDTVLDAGRRIASALTKEAIYDEARAASLRLLRGERCRVIELDADDDEDGQPLGRNAKQKLDLRMVARAVRTGRAIAFTEELAEATSDQADAPGGSGLCVPILVRGRTAACLYVAHHQVSGLFGADEERLADFVAAIAGAALENAEGFHQLQTLNATLEQRVAERTAAAEARARELARSNQELERVANELRRTEEQLRVAIDAAESASRAKTQFLTTMSHEIRTPMNGILGMTELALQTALAPQQRSYLTTIKQSGECLLTILNDVLDLSKIEAGRMELERIPFEVRDVIGASVRLLAVTASQKGIELICRVGPEVPAEICGDPTRLRQVVVNLVGNAIKFTAQGSVLINTFVEEGENGPLLHLAVQDTGVGIPSDKQLIARPRAVTAVRGWACRFLPSWFRSWGAGFG
jgi:two-component system sensor kinase